MAKQCSFCTFASDDVAAFGDHMRDVHQWDRLALARPGRRARRVTMFAVAGGVIAVAALYLLVWNMEQSCLRSYVPSQMPCTLDWYIFLFGVLPVAAIGIGLGAVVGHRLGTPRAMGES